MGYRPTLHQLELAEYQTGDPDTSLTVKVVAPTMLEAGDMNAGKRTLENGEQESAEAYLRRCMTYLAPKIKSWNLDTEDGVPVSLPSDAADGVVLGLPGSPGRDSSEWKNAAVDHLMRQDENIVLAIYHEWRLVSLPKKKDTPEGKDSTTPSTPGPGASSQEWDLTELEQQIPM
jgi:hypothetical protein